MDEATSPSLVRKAMLPRQLKPGTAYLCMRPGDHGIVSTSSMFLFQEARQSQWEAGSSARHPALGTREGLCWGRWIFPFRQLPCCDPCHGLVLPCLPIVAICCPGFNSEPVHTAPVLWHSYSQAPGGMAGMEQRRASCSLLHDAPSHEAVQASAW